jgi:hypothetical protein
MRLSQHALQKREVQTVAMTTRNPSRSASRNSVAIGRDLLDGCVTSDGATRDYGVGDPGDLLLLGRTED